MKSVRVFFMNEHSITTQIYFIPFTLIVNKKVFGAQGNTHIAKHTAVKHNAQETTLKSIAYDNIIYSTDITPLTLRITKSGNISVAITSQPPFISYFDGDLLPVKYISFRFV